MAKKKSSAAGREDQRRSQESDKAQQATARKNQPHEIREGANMKRQGKGMHRQDGKSS